MGKHKKRLESFVSDSSSDSESPDDSEFLNLAKKKKSQPKSGTSSPSPETPIGERLRKPPAPSVPFEKRDSDTTESDDEWGVKKPLKKKKLSKSNGKRTPKYDSENFENKHKNKDASDLEEGELSDSDSSIASDEEFNDGYADDFMGDEEDRAKLASMTEKEREQEIFKRAEHREVLKTRFNIEKKLKQAKRDMQKQRLMKRKEADAQPLDLKERVQERKKTVAENRGKVDKKAHAMNLLKARREERKEREEKEKKQKIEDDKKKEGNDREDEKENKDDKMSINASNKTRLKASDIYSDDSSSDDNESVQRKSTVKSKSSTSSDVSSDSDNRSVARAGKKIQYITTKDELNKIRLSRFKLEKFVHLPFFKEIAVGCFAKIGIGNHNGRSVYRAAEIIDVVETGKVYQLGPTKTNKGLRVRHGTQERTFRLEFISNQEFTDSEFSKYQESCTLQGVPIPTVEQLEQKIKDIKEALMYEFKEEDINFILKEKEKFKTGPFNYAMRKTELMKQRDMHKAAGDLIEAKRIQDELNELEQKANELDKRRTSTISSISYINNRNRKRNIEEAEKAIMAEVRANKGQKIDDPFTRRHTKPSMVFKSKTENAESLAVSSTELENLSNEETITQITINSDLSYGVINNETGNKIAPKKLDDLYSAHDFDITIELDVPMTHVTNVTPVVQNSQSGSSRTSSTGKRTLNLEDYKKKRGLI